MNILAEILPPNNIILDLDVTSKKRAFEQLGLLFENNHQIARSKVFDSLFARERLGSTALGYQVAIPHGRIKELNKPIAAFIRLKEGIQFDSPDNDTVRLLITLLVPEEATQQHLEILAEIANILSKQALRTALLEAPDAHTARQVLISEQLADC